MPLLHPSRPHTAPAAPHLDSLYPRSAIPGGSFQVFGSHLLPPDTAHPSASPQLPTAFFGEIPATFDMARSTRAIIRVPAGAISSGLSLRSYGLTSNQLHANIGVPMVEDLHVISNPAVDADGNLFAMVSGPRGEQVPVSIYRVARDLQVTAFTRGLLNVSALAFGRDGNLYASSRSEGAIYRITPDGIISTFAEGMGIATGIAFDREGNLFVGDRSGTIFKIVPASPETAREDSLVLNPQHPGAAGEIFVFATLEPSTAFYHLCFRPDGILLVTTPTYCSHQPIYAIDPKGETSTFYRGLGRPQGMAFDVEGNLYVAASLRGHRGLIRLWPSRETGDLQAELIVAGNDLIGLCFLDDGCVALATHSTIYHADLGIQGLSLF
ncbi:MAG: gluconolaconase [Acidobacteriaceae bacterium]